MSSGWSATPSAHWPSNRDKKPLPSAATAAWLGVATMDAASGAKVGVTSGGVQELTAGGAIAVGANVMSAAAGKVVTIGAGTAFQVVGIALTVASADGDKIRVKMAR